MRQNKALMAWAKGLIAFCFNFYPSAQIHLLTLLPSMTS